MALAGLAVGLALVVAVFEVVFRLFFPQPLYAETLVPWGVWHQANASFVHASDGRLEGRPLAGTEYLTHISYDSFGIRGPQHQVEKAPGLYRIVILGESSGDAMEVEFPDTMGQVLERTLNEQRAALGRAAPSRGPLAGAPPPDASPLSVAVWRELLRVTGDVPVIVASFQVSPAGREPRALLFGSLGLPWVSLQEPPEELPRYRFRYDGHWNAAGNARGASLVAARILASPPSGQARQIDRVEVVNLSHAAYDTCQYGMIYDALGAQFRPDLVLVVDSGSDVNPSSADLCRLDRGTLQVTPRSYDLLQRISRGARTFIRANSHFLTWVVDRLDRLQPRGDDVPVGVPQAQDRLRLVDPPPVLATRPLQARSVPRWA